MITTVCRQKSSNMSPGPGARKTMDTDLVDLVGQYLARHSQQSYVNMEHMVDSIRDRTYRFARMKRATVMAMVKRAYQRYVSMQMTGEEPTNLEKEENVDAVVEELEKVSSDSEVEIMESPKQSNVNSSDPAKPGTVSKSSENVIPSSTAVPASSQRSLSPGAKPSCNTSTVSAIDSTSLKRGVKRKRVKMGQNLEFTTDVEDKSPNSLHTPKTARKRVFPIFQSPVSFADFAGSERVIEEICQLLLHLKHPEIYQTLGVTPPRGFILHGPPGCGKSLLASAISGELKVPTLKLAATELVSGISGETEGSIRDLFQQAVDLAPSIIFLDEIDAITQKRENAQREMERRIVSQILACIDDLAKSEKGNSVFLIGATNRIETIDAALRRAGRFDREINIGIPDEKSREQILRVICKGLKLEPNFSFEILAKLTPGYVGADLQALIREATIIAVKEVLSSNHEALHDSDSKKSESEVSGSQVTTVPVSSAEAVENGPTNDHGVTTEIVTTVSKVQSPEENPEVIDLDDVSEAGTPTDSAVANDSMECLYDDIITGAPSLKRKAVVESKAPSRWIHDSSPLSTEQLEGIFVKLNHFQEALKRVQPSSKREGFATVPDTTWDDIGALKEIRDELQVSILGPVKYKAAFDALRIPAAGVLLCGPPGCGKTLLAKAVANEAGINFISVKGPELLNMYVGESERAVRQCFSRAKNSAPCVIFFDELDALCPRRSGMDVNSTSRVVNQLLTEMDGMETREGVFIMAATNRPDIIDPAVLRPGRLDKILFVNLPSPEDRADILKTITRNGSSPKTSDDVDFAALANDDRCSNYTGADLAALVREASVAAFRELVLEQKLKEDFVGDLKVYQRHFETALQKIAPSVSAQDLVKYDQMRQRYSRAQ